jgi:peptidoglycan/xylan/chitin deacetylase (PgdA/CDA1 family)
MSDRIALTFDDDPKITQDGTVPTGTSELLRVVEELNQTAPYAKRPIRLTFFVVGVNVEKMLFQQPMLLTRMVMGGHEIANHSYSHPKNFHQLSVDQALEEVGKTHDVILHLLGQRPRFFRPPYGLISQRLIDAIVKEFPSYQVAGWHRHDEKESYTAAQLSQVVVQQAQGNQVVLLHGWYQSTLWAMRSILQGLRDRGFYAVTMGELSGQPPLGGLKGL